MRARLQAWRRWANHWNNSFPLTVPVPVEINLTPLSSKESRLIWHGEPGRRRLQERHHQLGADLSPVCGEARRGAVCVKRPQICSVRLAGGVRHHSRSLLKHATGTGSPRGGDRRTAGRAGSQSGSGGSGRVASLAPHCVVCISACQSRVIAGLLDWTVSTKPLNTSSPMYWNCSYLCFSRIPHGDISMLYPTRIRIRYISNTDRGDLTYPCN